MKNTIICNKKLLSLTIYQRIQKRTFDLVFSFIGLLFTWWIILLAWFFSSLETGSNGFFFQQRVGRYGKNFVVIKVKTMRFIPNNKSTVTTCDDTRITKFGKFFRDTKIDELPQLINVFLGQMSFVGPRPDVPGYADLLQGYERSILLLRPGITGPASLKYKNEEEILGNESDPQYYNDNVIWPDKIIINLEYIKSWSFFSDIKYILKTFLN